MPVFFFKCKRLIYFAVFVQWLKQNPKESTTRSICSHGIIFLQQFLSVRTVFSVLITDCEDFVRRFISQNFNETQKWFVNGGLPVRTTDKIIGASVHLKYESYRIWKLTVEIPPLKAREIKETNTSECIPWCKTWKLNSTFEFYMHTWPRSIQFAMQSKGLIDRNIHSAKKTTVCRRLRRPTDTHL